MNKTAIKNYAVEARKKWIQAIARQADFYGCTENGSLTEIEIEAQLADKGIFLTQNEKSARNNLVSAIKENGFEDTIEEIAYTWFNRLIAIRFMEVNGYLPSGIRMLSSIDSERIEPDCVREYARLDFLNQDTASKLADESDDKLYRYILVEQCNALGKIMPKMFTHIGGIASLLLPERLYIKDGLVHDLTHGIDEADFDISGDNSDGQIEIIGWLYQYYISEKKDEVFAALKKNVKITRENIPAATQLFTPEWIVKYMVENSLGRLWLERHPNSSLRQNWKYYLDEAEQTPEVMAQLRGLVEQSPIGKPEEIRLIDPCMGSGHILVYAFDVLFQIYQSVGYAERDIPDLILTNNIYGLDIDERACQLAYFALMMKARSYNRRFFRREEVPQPQVYCPQGYEEGMEYGSLVKVEVLEEKPDEPTGQISLEDTDYQVKLNAWNFRRLLHQKYDVVVTNPPYMGSSGMGAKMSEYVKKNYPDSKSDLFAVFIEKCGELLNKNGYQAMITQHAWMFLSSYEKLRAKLLHRSIINMAHLGARAFEEIGGEVVQTTAFVMAKKHIAEYTATYVRLVDFNSQQAKEDAFLAGGNRHTAKQDNFEKIPGEPVAYWVNEGIANAYKNGEPILDYVDTFQGIITGNNEKFLRFWYEVDGAKIPFHASNMSSVNLQKQYWIPYNKGGEFRKWYGIQDYVVNWKNGPEDKTRGKKGFSNFYLREYVAWSYTISDSIATRYYPEGFLWDVRGSGIMDKTNNLYYLQGLITSKIGITFLQVKSSVMSCQVENIVEIPIIMRSNNEVENLVHQNISLSRTDWDSFEISWDFVRHPLINGERSLSAAFDKWQAEAETRFNTLKANEEELNRIFIDIYGLQDELTPEVEDKDVTVRKADLEREIRSFISYAVGCMFGRYSLDTEGLAYAGGGWDDSKYGGFIPEADNILPITDDDYFDDDIVTRFVKFVEIVYSKDSLTENLDFIAKALYPNANGTAREQIRRYFLTDFFKDHCKIYKKRPIYWLFDSAGNGKQNGFKALVYLHRYDKYTVARVRTEYLHPLQRKYEAEIQRMSNLADLPETSVRDKAEFKKQIEKIEKQIAECRSYDQIISHVAGQAIELDLDDGVKVNYAKFQSIEVPRDDGKGAVKMDLLAKI